MRFRITIRERRIVEEIWYAEADNAEEAREQYYASCADFDEERVIDTQETWVEDVENLDDPDGLLETDEGL